MYNRSIITFFYIIAHILFEIESNYGLLMGKPKTDYIFSRVKVLIRIKCNPVLNMHRYIRAIQDKWLVQNRFICMLDKFLVWLERLIWLANYVDMLGPKVATIGIWKYFPFKIFVLCRLISGHCPFFLLSFQFFLSAIFIPLRKMIFMVIRMLLLDVARWEIMLISGLSDCCLWMFCLIGSRIMIFMVNQIARIIHCDFFVMPDAWWPTFGWSQFANMRVRTTDKHTFLHSIL